MDKIDDLMNRSLKETRDLRYDLALKHIEMHKHFTDPRIDDATLLAKQKELSSLHRKLLDNMARTMIESRKILTPEQLARLDQMPPPRAGIMGKYSD
jgi:Spy/CpxP family protein refolding chaperone